MNIATIDFVPNNCKRFSFLMWYIFLVVMVALTAINSTYNTIEWRKSKFPKNCNNVWNNYWEDIGEGKQYKG